MPECRSELDDTLLEECIDELDAAVDRLDRFPAFVLAFAMRAQLLALLQALTVSGQIGDRELRGFLAGLQAAAAADEGEGEGET